MNNRWVANKFGLFNFWYYENQEFELNNGKVLFRGTNGSGKSVTTQSFIPLLLDGDKRPHRIDPFGTKARKIENYLLVDESEDERIAYLYMEFKKPCSNIYMTIGMGLRAKRGKNLDACYFILKDGKRINKDIKLYKNSGQMLPLTFSQLKNIIEKGNVYTTSQQEYMKKVNEHLYGYSDIENYKELLNLLIELRSPKLSKDFKPTVIYNILKKSLSTLSEDDLRTMAEAMDNMDVLNNRLDELQRSLDICNEIGKNFDKYNQYNIYKVAKKFKNKQDEVKETNEKLNALKDTIEKNECKLKENIEKQKNLEIELKVSQDSYKALEKSEALSIKEDINKDSKQLKLTIEKINSTEYKYNLKKDRFKKYEDDITILENNIYKNEKDIKNLLIDEQNLRIETYYEENNDFNKAILNNNNYNFEIILQSINEYENLISQIYKDIVKYESKKEQSEELQQKQDSKEIDIKVCKNKLNEAIEYLTTIKIEYIENISNYIKNCSELKLDNENLQTINKIINDIQKRFQYQNILSIVKEYKDNKDTELNKQKLEINYKKDNIKQEIDILNLELAKLNNDKIVFEEDENFIKNKTILSKEKIPYKKFYECINFKDNLDENQKKIIEQSLLEMGIINTLIIPNEYKDKCKKLLENNVYKIIDSDKPYENENISEYLQIDNDSFTKEYKNEIENILKSIGIKDTEYNTTSIDIENNYKIGILKGKCNFDYELKYIGSKAREDYRLSKIKDIELNINEKSKKIEELDYNLSYINTKIKKLEKEYKDFSNGEDLDESIKLIDELEISLNREEVNLNNISEELHKINKELKNINSLLFENTQYIKIPKNINSYNEAMSSIREYKVLINEIKDVYNLKNSEIENLKNKKVNIDEIKIDIDEIISNIYELKDDKVLLEERIESLNKVLLSLNIKDVEEEINKLLNITSTYPNEINIISTSIGEIKNNIENKNNAIEDLNKRLEILNKELDYYGKNFNYECNLKYIKEIIGLDEEKAIHYIIENYKNTETYKINTIASEIHDIIGKHVVELSNHNIKVVDVDSIYKGEYDEIVNRLIEDFQRFDIKVKLQQKAISIYDLIENLRQNIEECNLLISQGERDVFEDILINTLSTKINARIHRAKAWVKDIDSLMSKVNTSNGLKLNISWVPKKSESEEDLGINELSSMLSTHKFMNEEERQKISDYFKVKLKKQKRIMQDENKVSSYQAIIKEVLDFREWFEFKLMYTRPNENKKELTDNEFFRLSGGEKAMSMYIPLFAAVNARYDGADKKDCPRMISLDEAFAGVDDKNISHMFNLMENLNLDYVLNSQVLWGTYEGVSDLAIYELIRDGKDVVIPIKYNWNGKEKIVDMGE